MPKNNVEVSFLNYQQNNFWFVLEEKLNREDTFDDGLTVLVKGIIDDVKQNKDQALLKYTNEFDQLNAKSVKELIIPKQELKKYFDSLDKNLIQSLEFATDRIKKFHQQQVEKSWSYINQNQTKLGFKITPIEKVGIYIPGGLACYPSSVLMNAIPAKLAGVHKLIMVVPTPKNQINSTVLAAAHLAQVDQVIRIGGAQAIAALAYGTQSVEKVYKITGPGNKYVAEAKKQVFGKVGIDMIAGPSELCVVCDESIDAKIIAADLCAQAEHDVNSQVSLICCNDEIFKSVLNELDKLIVKLGKKDIILQSLNSNALFIKVDNFDQACEVVNEIAPEHLQLNFQQAQDYVEKIHNAGAIFIGKYSCEVFGDYCIGSNHVLPTNRTAKFSSPLGLADFQKKSSIIDCSNSSKSEVSQVAKHSYNLAIAEDLEAHSISAKYRI